MPLAERVSRRCFQWVHRNNLVYNTCWEDPRLDREAMRLGPDDSVLVITSAGCNALDYLLDEPREVHAVDMNPRQNALLDLKIAGIRALEFGDFFQMFGKGRLEGARDVYIDRLRPLMPSTSRRYWDRNIDLFDDRRGTTFYFRGTSGSFARFINFYIDRVVRVRPIIESLWNADSLAQQRQIYQQELKPAFWGTFVRWLVRRDSTLSLLGVPRPQRRQVEASCVGGIAGFIERCLAAVFSELPLADNYFWRVYLTGRYDPHCSPEYLKPVNFARLKAGLVDRLTTNTDTVQGFLERHDRQISRFVLLDHMDWLASMPEALSAEWQAILDRAAPAARFLWRSGGTHTEFVDEAEVRYRGRPQKVGRLLSYQQDKAARLHAADRVHTYAGFKIADLIA